MTRALRKNMKEKLAIVGLVLIASAVAYYILQHQRLRIPLLDAPAFELKAKMVTAQAVTPGQGQTVRVSGVRVGDIAGSELVDGQAVVTLELDDEYKDLVHTDATAFLRPKTGLKDMFLELNPGTKGAPVVKEGWTIPLHATLPDVNPDEILAGLDTDTRDYLKLLLNGAGRGLEGRGDDLRAVLRRFEPTYRDLSRVSRATATRRVELRRLINSLARLNRELAGKDDELAQLVDSAATNFRAIASERQNVSGAVRELPSALRQATSTLARVDEMAQILGPTAEKLRPVARALQESNARVRPFAVEAAPQLRKDIRPFVRRMRPFIRSLTPAAEDLVDSEPTLTRSITVLNHLFNMLGFNPGGREEPDVATREEGYLFHLGWLGHQTVNIFGNADAHGPMRPLTLGGTCTTLQGTARSAPGLEFLLGLTGALTDPRVCGGPTSSTSTPKRTPISEKAR